jgi:hypothetical protein
MFPALASPDRKWLLFPDVLSGESIVLPVNGPSRYKQIAIANPDPIHSLAIEFLASSWYPDSKTWMDLESCLKPGSVGIYALEYNVGFSKPDRVVPLGRPMGSIKDPGHDTCQLLGPVSETQFLVTTMTYELQPDTKRAQEVFFDLDIHHKPAITHYYSIYLPKGLNSLDIALDTSHRMLAWLVGSSDDLEHDYIPHTIILAVSDLDGGHWRSIGTLNPPQPPMKAGSVAPRYFFDRPHSLKWLPDGRHVQFVFNRAIWTVPVS